MDTSCAIAFVYPPTFNHTVFQPHLGVAYIQAYLKRRGIRSEQVQPSLCHTINECVDDLIRTGAPLIGFCCYDANFYLVRSLAAEVRRRRPDAVLLAGGPSATFSDRVILDHIPEIDIAVRFEGEETVLEVITHLFDGLPPDQMDGIGSISFRRRARVVRTPDKPLYAGGDSHGTHLDDLPSPYLEGVLDGTEEVGLVSARGCTHRCTYCNFSAMSRHTVRFHSIDRVISEFKVIQAGLERKGVLEKSTVAIHDDTFTLNPQRAKRICRRIIEEGLKLNLSCMGRADCLDEELVALFKQAGFANITIGLESAVPRVLRNVKKVCALPPDGDHEEFLPEKRFLEAVERSVAWAKKYDLETFTSIILGLPGETRADGMATVEFVKHLDVDLYTHNWLVPHAGTEVFETAHKYDIVVEPSRCVLPYHIRHAYDLLEVPYMTNSWRMRDQRVLVQNFARQIAGGKCLHSGTGNGVVSALVEVENRAQAADAIEWLTRWLAVNGCVFVWIRDTGDRDKVDDIRDCFFTSRLPTHGCHFVADDENGCGSTLFRFLEDDLYDWRMRFPLVRLSEYAGFCRERGEAGKRDFPLYLIESREDVDILSVVADMVTGLENDEAEGFPPEGVFYQGCRWGRSPCPALELRQVVIDRDGRIRPCVTGPVLGDCDDPIGVLRKRAGSLHTTLARNMDCDHCPAGASCPKCLFPAPFTREEYCDIQRNAFDIGALITRTNLANALDAMNH